MTLLPSTTNKQMNKKDYLYSLSAVSRKQGMFRSYKIKKSF